MIFSISTMLTHVLLCAFLLFLIKKVFARPSNYSPKCFTWIFAIYILCAIRLLFPFEYSFTKTIYITPIYTPLCDLLRTHVMGISVFTLLLSLSLFSTICMLLKRILQQRRYINYLNSLPCKMRIPAPLWFNKKRVIRCVIDPANTNPLAICFFNPQIVLPKFPISREEQKVILLHEEYHCNSCDMVLKWCVEGICCLFWFVPFISVLREHFSIVSELRADQYVVQHKTNEEKTQYLECMLKVAKLTNVPSVFPALSFSSTNRTTMKERFHCILSPKNATLKQITMIFLICTLFLFSHLFVLEPYHVVPTNHEHSFSLGQCKIVQASENVYAFYIENDYSFTLHYLPQEFSNMPIYPSRKEAGL